MRKRVTIITPYKEIEGHSPDWIVEYLKSLKAQTCQSFTLVWVGNWVYSQERTIRNKFTLLTLHSSAPVAASVMYAATYVPADYLSVLPSNDTIHPDFLNAAVTALDANPDADYWACNGSYLTEEIMRNNTMCGAFVMRKSSWDRLGGFMQSPDGETGMEDWHLWMRAYSRGSKGVVDDRELFYWRRHDETSVSGKLIGTPLMESKLKWMRENL